MTSSTAGHPATPLAAVRLSRRRLLGLGLAAAGADVLAARGAAGTTAAAPGASSDGRLITWLRLVARPPHSGDRLGPPYG